MISPKQSAKRVLRIEAEAILALVPRIGRDFEQALELLSRCKGRIVVTGMGKPGIIGQKISATLASTGTPSLSLHPADAAHGDLGRVRKDDVVVTISNSGETEEITRLIPLIKKIGARLIAITGSPGSTLSRAADVVLDVSVRREACSLNLAPTASTTAMLALGDALAISLLEKKGFKIQDYAFFHPAGTLGKRLLLKVDDLMRTGARHPVVQERSLVKEALFKITRARAGSACVVNSKGSLVGIFTDGDLRRGLANHENLAAQRIGVVMTRRPITVRQGQLAVEALKILQERKIDEVPVIDQRRRPVGLLDVQDLLKAGLV